MSQSSPRTSHYRSHLSAHRPLSKRSASRRLRFEPLETRRLLSITVDTLVDENNGVGVGAGTSLREAIAAAAPGDTINFAVAGTINLSIGTSDSTKNLTIDKNLTIQGPGVGLLTINAFDPTPTQKNGDGSQVFHIAGPSPTQLINVTIRDVTLSGADSATVGGAIFATANLEIDNCTITNNRATTGAGIYSVYTNQPRSTLTIRNSIISGNVATDHGGGFYEASGTLILDSSTFTGNSAASGGGFGVGFGPVTCTNCTIQNNQAVLGGGVYSRSKTFDVSNCVISQNSAKFGAGLFLVGVSTDISGCDISGNTATESGGGLFLDTAVKFTLTNTTLRDNSAHNGGGIFDSTLYAPLNVSNCVISGNRAFSGNGGGVSVTNLVATGSEFSDNSAAGSGGGIYSKSQVGGSLSLTNCTISGNTAGVGGGIFSWSQLGSFLFATITNSTISGNTAVTAGGGLASKAGYLTIQFSTVTLNAAPDGMGSGVDSTATSSSALRFISTIIAGNTHSDIDDTGNGTTLFQSNGYNLIGTGNRASSFNQPGDQVGILDPQLAPLADNGGPTKTHALLSDSPAFNAGDPAAVAGAAGVPAYDERGKTMSRIAGGRIDIGAYESQPIPAPFMGDFNVDGFVNMADYVVWRANQGATGLTPYTGADGTGDGVVGPDDYTIWREHFGATVPVAPSMGSGQVIGFNESITSGDQLVASSPTAVDRPFVAHPLSFGGSLASKKTKLVRQANSIQSLSHDDAFAAWLVSPPNKAEFLSGDSELASSRQRLRDSDVYIDSAFAAFGHKLLG
jgi:predicted outer membrane repeat protein